MRKLVEIICLVFFGFLTFSMMFLITYSFPHPEAILLFGIKSVYSWYCGFASETKAALILACGGGFSFYFTKKKEIEAEVRKEKIKRYKDFMLKLSDHLANRTEDGLIEFIKASNRLQAFASSNVLNKLRRFHENDLMQRFINNSTPTTTVVKMDNFTFANIATAYFLSKKEYILVYKAGIDDRSIEYKVVDNIDCSNKFISYATEGSIPLENGLKISNEVEDHEKIARFLLDSLKEKYSAPSIAVDDLLFAIRKDINLNSAGIEKRNNRFFNFMHSFVVSYRMYPQIESQGIDPWIIENGTAKYRFIQQTTNW